ncbi:MAG: class I SAM-dependent methyltransferase [Acidimicrobiales bacterium]
MARKQYVFANAWEMSDRRLGMLELVHDPVTARRMGALGLAPGWRCLEVGAGRGSVARHLCAEAGRQGRVVAVDIDVGLLQGIEADNLEVLQLDVVADPLPPGPFDLVHTRLLLMHLPEREQVLQRLVATVAPGGFVLFEEHDVFPIQAAADGAYGAAWSVFVRAVEAGGVAPTWVRSLPARCESLGLVDVATDVDVPFFCGGSPEAEFWQLTWLQTMDRILGAGAPRETAEAGIEALADPGRWFYGPAMVAVSARRP